MIPLAKDTRESIGAFAEKVENRSLLFEKMVLSKSSLHEVPRFEDAQRFNVLRATHEGNLILQEEQQSARSKAGKGGRNADAEAYKAKVASALAGIRVDDPVLAKSRIRSTTRLMIDLEKSYQGQAATFIGALGGRLLINMAGGVMENSGLSLDRVTGLPLIPGTAIKGISRHQALWEIRRAADTATKVELVRKALAVFGFSPNDLSPKGDFLWATEGDRALLDKALQVFGSDTYKGVCSFLGASPSDLDSLKIVAEVLTPHFNNNLRPIFFPAVEAGAQFAFAIIAQRDPHSNDLDRTSLLDQAKSWLQAALTENGIGAKTGAGYGWFSIDPQAEDKRRAAMEQEARLAEEQQQREAARTEEVRRETEKKKAEDERRDALAPIDRATEDISKLNDQEFNDFAKSLAEKDPDEQAAFLKVLNSPAKKERRKQWKKKKQDLWSQIVEIALKQKIELK